MARPPRPFLTSLGLAGLILALCGALTLIGNVSGIAQNTAHFVPAVSRENLPGLMLSTGFFAVLALVPSFFTKKQTRKPQADDASESTH